MGSHPTLAEDADQMNTTAMTARNIRTRANIIQGKARMEDRPKAKAKASGAKAKQLGAWMMIGSSLLGSKPVTPERRMKEAVFEMLMMTPTVHGQ